MAVVAGAIERLHASVPDDDFGTAPEFVISEREAGVAAGVPGVTASPATKPPGVEPVIEQSLSIDGDAALARRPQALDDLGSGVAHEVLEDLSLIRVSGKGGKHEQSSEQGNAGQG
jgi:hypothetical protein